MTKIADIYTRRADEPLFICDFSPPRGPDYGDVAAARALNADCFSVPYNPGKSVYSNSAFAAHALRTFVGKEVVFTLATRDMNILGAQSLLLGAALLGLQNVIVVRGDDFTAADLGWTKEVNDYTPSALIRAIAHMNEGIDFRGRALSAPTDFCIGATIDINRRLETELPLTRRKIEAGAHFLITQPGFSSVASIRFLEAYERTHGEAPPIPIFFGIQMMTPGARSFSPVPQAIRDYLDAGITADDIASRTIDAFLEADLAAFYLMPPILPGGVRDYAAAQSVLNRYKTS